MCQIASPPSLSLAPSWSAPLAWGLVVLIVAAVVSVHFSTIRPLPASRARRAVVVLQMGICGLVVAMDLLFLGVGVPSIASLSAWQYAESKRLLQLGCSAGSFDALSAMYLSAIRVEYACFVAAIACGMFAFVLAFVRTPLLRRAERLRAELR